MTKPLLAILLLLPLSVSADEEVPLLIGEEARVEPESLEQGELDGKAVACVLKDPRTTDKWLHEYVYWFEFKDGQVTCHGNKIDGTTAVSFNCQIDSRPYETTIKTVRWWKQFTLNRETLALNRQSIWVTATSKNEESSDYDCEVVDSPEAMHKAIEAARLETQRKIDEEMKDNKI